MDQSVRKSYIKSGKVSFKRPALTIVSAGLGFLWVVLSLSCGGDRLKTIEDAPVISIQITDDSGEMLSFREAPQRIISLAPNLTEMMFFLGESHRLSGVSQACDFPDEARFLNQVTTFPEIDREAILALEPECLLATSEIFSPAQTDWFRQQGIPVLYQQYTDLESVWKGMEQLAMLCGNKSKGKAICDSFRMEVASIRQSARSAHKVCILVNSAPLMIAGRNSFLHDIIEVAGGNNSGEAFERAYVEVDAEFLLQENPDFMVIPAREDSEALAFIERYPALRKLQAVEGKRIFRVDPSVYFRPGPRSLEALKELHAILHPGD
jgi:iron complex transport system substrate-binding protein